MRFSVFQSIVLRSADGEPGAGFQPIVDVEAHHTVAWEALADARGARLSLREAERAIIMAAAGGLTEEGALLALPLDDVLDPDDAATHLFCTALAHGMSARRLLVQISASEQGGVGCGAALAAACRRRGIRIALDGYASGPVGIKLLGQARPELLRLDPALTRNIAASPSRRHILEGVLRLGRTLGMTVVASGIVSGGDLAGLRALGVANFQSDALDALPAPRRGHPPLLVPSLLPTLHVV